MRRSLRPRRWTRVRCVHADHAVRMKSCLALAVVLLLALAGTAQAAIITPTTPDDPIGSGACPGDPRSLRHALAFARAGDTIQLENKTYKLTQGNQIITAKTLSITGAGRDA